jgi:hypothetical protein
MKIIYCGEYWDLGPIDTLKKALRECTLDPAFENYGDFFYQANEEFEVFASRYPSKRLLARLVPCKPAWHFFGNFLDLSLVFRLEVESPDDPQAIELQELIAYNKSTARYISAKN